MFGGYEDLHCRSQSNVAFCGQSKPQEGGNGGNLGFPLFVYRRPMGDDERHVHHCPICNVLSSSVFAVFMSSALVWYEREAEIMFTISSITFTFGIVT